jgi:pimeloyl-ACP methyl ester carboxylesterase
MKRQILTTILVFLCLMIYPQSPPYPNSSFIKIDGVRFHYRYFAPNESNPPKATVLLIHGFAGSTFSWRNNIKAIIDVGCAVVAVDLPAFGYSDRRNGPEMSLEEKGILIWQLADSIGRLRNCNGQWVLAGHSMGGAYIDMMLALNPLKIIGLVYVDAPGILFASASNAGRAQNMLGSLLAFISSPILSPILTHDISIRKMLTSAYGREPNPNEILGYQVPLQQFGTGAAILRLNNNLEDSCMFAPGFYPPSLIIWGEKDDWIPYFWGEILQNNRLGSKLHIIRGAAHCPMETHPEEFNTLLNVFLREIIEY